MNTSVINDVIASRVILIRVYIGSSSSRNPVHNSKLQQKAINDFEKDS